MLPLRSLRLALPLVLLAAGAAASSATALEPVEYTACSMLGGWDEFSMDCGDPEANARMRARMLTREQAIAAGCPPLMDDREDTAESEPAESGEPEPTPTPRAPDPAVAGRVNGAWDRIERWLGAHASATLRKLRFPAEPGRVALWEQNLKVKFPDDLYASLLRHDGADGNFGAAFPLPPAHGLAAMTSYGSIQQYNCMDLVMEGRMGDDAWHGGLVPFAADGYGHELFVDPATGRTGEKGQDGRLRYDGPMGWPSYLALLEAVATSLEGGTALRDWHPVVTGGCELRWAEEPAPALPGGCAGGPRPTPIPTPTPTPDKPTAEEIRATGCKPARRAPVFHRPPAKVSAEVGAVWRRIERWLARKAPVTYRGLEGPARPGDIARAEAKMGLRFPDDLTASLLRHDGGDFGPAPFYVLMSADALHRDWAMLCGILLENLEESYEWWDGHLIPFADAGDGGNLFIDTRTGKTGEYYNESGLRLDGDVVWPSYLALLRDTATALEKGKPIRGWRPVVTKGALGWKSTR